MLKRSRKRQVQEQLSINATVTMIEGSFMKLSQTSFAGMSMVKKPLNKELKMNLNTLQLWQSNHGKTFTTVGNIMLNIYNVSSINELYQCLVKDTGNVIRWADLNRLSCEEIIMHILKSVDDGAIFKIMKVNTDYIECRLILTGLVVLDIYLPMR